MAPLKGTDTGASASDINAEPVLLGKRYADPETGLELLCSKAGDGPLTVDDRPLGVKAPKALPSSD